MKVCEIRIRDFDNGTVVGERVFNFVPFAPKTVSDCDYSRSGSDLCVVGEFAPATVDMVADCLNLDIVKCEPSFAGIPCYSQAFTPLEAQARREERESSGAVLTDSNHKVNSLRVTLDAVKSLTAPATTKELCRLLRKTKVKDRSIARNLVRLCFEGIISRRERTSEKWNPYEYWVADNQHEVAAKVCSDGFTPPDLSRANLSEANLAVADGKVVSRVREYVRVSKFGRRSVIRAHARGARKSKVKRVYSPEALAVKRVSAARAREAWLKISRARRNNKVGRG